MVGTNKEILQTNNTTISTNNSELISILETINNLPEVGGGDTRAIEEAFIKRSFTEYSNDFITSIGNSAFRASANLEKVSFTKSTNTGEYAFYDCSKLVEVNFPVATTVSSQCFRGCSKLAEVNFPMATSVSSYSFYTNTALEKVRIPKVTSIGLSAFNGCSNLKTLIIEQTSSVCTLGNNTFASSGIANGTGYIYVPDTMVDSYKNHTNWASFASQIKPLSELEE